LLGTQLFCLRPVLSPIFTHNRILRLSQPETIYIWFFIPNLMILVYSFPSQPYHQFPFPTPSTENSLHVSLLHSPSLRCLWSPPHTAIKPPNASTFSPFRNSFLVAPKHYTILPSSLSHTHSTLKLRLQHIHGYGSGEDTSSNCIGRWSFCDFTEEKENRH